MYPTPMEDVNLRAMQTIQDKFGVAVGYSDHTLGIELILQLLLWELLLLKNTLL